MTIDRPTRCGLPASPTSRWPELSDLVVVTDWYGRYVPAWHLLDIIDTSFCLGTFEDALRKGRQRSSTPPRNAIHQHPFTDKFGTASVRIRMDGRGRCADNVFVERLWRSLRGGSSEDLRQRSSRRASASASGSAFIIRAGRIRPWTARPCGSLNCNGIGRTVAGRWAC